MFNTIKTQFIQEGKPYGLRLGQYFCVKYIKQSYPELFYTQDEAKAEKLIRKYLNDYQYFDTLPKVLFEIPVKE